MFQTEGVQQPGDDGDRLLSVSGAVGLIGPGRAGTVLAAAMRTVGRPVGGWTGRDRVSPAAQDRVRRLLPEVPRLSLARLVATSDRVLIAVPDAAIAGVVSQLVEIVATVPDPPTFYWHLSGLTGVAALDRLRAPGIALAALHPAMTFSGRATDLDRLDGLHWACTCAPADSARAHAVVEELGGRPLDVAEEDRATYHAALSHASNFLAVLQRQAVDLLAAAGIADGPALLGPLVRSALDDALGSTPAWTGPVSRADAGTIAAHLDVMADPDTRSAYVALTRATLHRMLADGSSDVDAVRRVEAVLDDLTDRR